MDPLQISQYLGVDLAVVERAVKNLKEGKASWIVVSGKMCSGKDSIAPLIQPALGYTDNVRLSFSDVIRIEADEAIKILTAREGTDEELAQELVKELHLKFEHALALTRMLREHVKDPNHTVRASMRSDLIRDILILFGSDWRVAEDPGYWSRQLVAMSLGRIAEGTSVYLTGGRFEPDVSVPQDCGALIIRLDITPETQAKRLLERDGLTPDPKAVNHISETALDNWARFDVRVNNDSSLEEGLEAVLNELKRVTSK